MIKGCDDFMEVLRTPHCIFPPVTKLIDVDIVLMNI